MSCLYMSHAWDISLHPNLKLTLLALADNSDDHGECSIALEILEEMTSFKRAEVIRCLEILKRDGFLEIEDINGQWFLKKILPEDE